MAKFGLFSGGSSEPEQVFEAERMQAGGEYVIFINKTGPGKADQVVGTVRLAPGQSVKEIK